MIQDRDPHSIHKRKENAAIEEQYYIRYMSDMSAHAWGLLKQTKAHVFRFGL